MTGQDPAADEARAFLAGLSQIQLVAIEPASRTVRGCDLGQDVERALKWAWAYSSQGHNIYYTVNEVRPGVNTKPSKADIVAARFAHVDIDPPKDGSVWIPEAIKRRLLDGPLPPSILIWSGNGWQALWTLTGNPDVETTERVNRSLIAYFCGDPGTQNIDRLLRVPGTKNYPNAKKMRLGRAVTEARLVKHDMGEAFTVEQLVKAYGHSLRELKTADSSKVRTSEPLAFDGLNLDADDYLRCLIEQPKGVDRSEDTFALACEMLRRRYSPEQITGVMLDPENAISEHCLAQPDPQRAAQRAIISASAEDDVARRNGQREVNRRIGDGTDTVPTTQIYSLQEMLDRFVYIKDGSQVADLTRPQVVLSLPDFRNASAGSKHKITGTNGAPKSIQASQAWLEHPSRHEADALTFHAGAARMTTEPRSGTLALNLWLPHLRGVVPDEWQTQAALFVDHVRWLWGEHADPFLDWLGHIEQSPGELPHHGWVHISRTHGKGRNWIASVLARLWRGNVAASLDLLGVLEGGFNDRLARCQLAIVDEINEGGNSSYRHAQALRQTVTAEFREINPKYGRRHVEYNATRWLIFSNHTGAIPLGEDDRRFYVVSHDGPAKPAKYYSNLYGKLNDPLFISAVAEFMRARDLSAFNPGMLPPITTAKANLIALTQSDDEIMLKEIAQRWPVEVVTASEVNSQLDRGVARWAVRYAMDRAGIRKLRKVRTGTGSEVVYAVRRFEHWSASSPEALRAEIDRLTLDEKLQALDAQAFDAGNGLERPTTARPSACLS